MASINRDTPDVSPNNFVRQGVVDNSASALVGGLFEAGITLDKGLAQERLGAEINETTAEYLASSPAAQVAEEGAQVVEREISPFRSELRKGAAARDQGKMSFQQYQVRVERATREAIARRPGLANEFRQIAASFSGGPAVDWLMRQEAALMDQAKTAAQKQQEQKEWLQKQRYEEAVSLGITIPPTATLDEADAYIIANQDNIDELRRAQRYADSTKLAADVADNEKKLIQPSSNQAYINEGRQILSEGWNKWQSVSVALTQPNITAEQIVQIMASGEVEIDQMIVNLRSSASKYSVDEATVGTFMDVLKNIKQGMKDFPTKTVAEQKNIVAGIQLQAEFLQIQNPDIAAIQAIGKVFPAEVLGPWMAQGGPFGKQAMIAAGQVLQGTASPEATAKYAGANTGVLVATLFDKATGEAKPEQKDALVTMQEKNAAAFVGVEDSKWSAGDWAGSNGWLANLRLQKEGLVKNLDNSEQVRISSGVAMAAWNAQRIVASRFFATYPALRGKVDVYIDPEDGKLLHPAGLAEGLEPAKLTFPEQQALDKYNSMFGGSNLLEVVGTLNGFKDRMESVKFIYDFQGVAEKTRSGALAARAPTVAPTRPAGPDSYKLDEDTEALLEKYGQ